MAIKEALKDELKNSIRILDRYQEELDQLPEGSLNRKKINSKEYYYIQRREGDKILSQYLGSVSKVSKEEVDRWDKIKRKRKNYRHSISKLKRQIKFLKGVVRGKESI